ncbi:MAG: hypothetical protein JNL36_07630 [Candidatus Kapabacteria bacterium]|nr:hypothetical protein [Candidatus Kapabacteria bacterium]
MALYYTGGTSAGSLADAISINVPKEDEFSFQGNENVQAPWQPLPGQRPGGVLPMPNEVVVYENEEETFFLGLPLKQWLIFGAVSILAYLFFFKD